MTSTDNSRLQNVIYIEWIIHLWCCMLYVYDVAFIWISMLIFWNLIWSERHFGMLNEHLLICKITNLVMILTQLRSLSWYIVDVCWSCSFASFYTCSWCLIEISLVNHKVAEQLFSCVWHMSMEIGISLDRQCVVCTEQSKWRIQEENVKGWKSSVKWMNRCSLLLMRCCFVVILHNRVIAEIAAAAAAAAWADWTGKR